MAKGNIIPALRYKDALAAIDWLCNTFGFERRLVVPGEEEGHVAHAQLVLGDGMVMLGTVRDDEYAIRPPVDAGCSTQGTVLVVDAIEAHYERAKAAGAEIVTELTEQPFGGSLYAARDPEGHVWFVGSYDPWA